MDGAEVPSAMPSWMELWNEWEIQVVVMASFSLQVILLFFAGIRRYSISSVLKALLWLVYLLADVVATYTLGHISSSLSKKSSGENQLVAFWAPFLLLHLGGQDTITAYALEDNKLWLRHLLNLFLQVAATAYVLYKYIATGGETFVHASMLVLAAGFVKYGERIWALKLASKVIKTPRAGSGRSFSRWMEERDCFTTNEQFRTYASLVMTAHRLRQVFLKPLIIDRNEPFTGAWNSWITEMVRFPCQREASESENEPADRKRRIGKVYKPIEVELALMYDMLYTNAEVIHTRYGYCIRAISLVSCFAALVVFTEGKRDGYSTPDIVITFALLGGACVLEMASVLKAIGSTWTCAMLQGQGWGWLAWVILFARYHLIVVKDGRWSDSVGQLKFISFCVRSHRTSLKGAIAKWIGLKDLWDKAHCTKHAKLSPAVKEFICGFLRGQKSHMVEIKEVDVWSGNWALRFSGFDESEELDGSMSFGFWKSVLIWHIATDTFLNDPAVKSQLDYMDVAEAISTLSDYMMYLLVRHPDILPIKANDSDCSLFEEACASFCAYFHTDMSEPHQAILDLNKHPRGMFMNKIIAVQSLMHRSRNANPSQVLMKACTLAQTMLRMKLDLTHKMSIIGTVWNKMLCYAATNASGGFHARQLSNGGEFLTHILLLTKYSSFIDKNNPKPPMEADETVEASAAGQVVVNVDDDCNDETIEIHPI